MQRRVTRRRRQRAGARLRRYRQRTTVAVLSWSLLVLFASPAGTSLAQPPTAQACADDVPSIRFYDVSPGSTHAAAIDCLAVWGISLGRAGHLYAPDDPVQRGHFASFLLRTLEQAGMTFQEQAPLTDADTANAHAAAAARLVAAGVLDAPGGRFDPEGPLRRDTMAVGLVTAYEQATGVTLPTPVGRPFSDLRGHDATIAKAVQLGLVHGTTDGTYDPSGTVTRGQLASFLQRLLDGLVDAELATPPTAPDWGPDIALAIALSEAVEQTRAPALLDPPLELAERTLTRLYEVGCVSDETTSPRCVFGATDADRTMVMYGDSHMAHWFPALDALATRHGWRIVVLTKGGCPAWDIEVRDQFGDPGRCADWRRHALQRIEALQPRMVLVSGASHYGAYDGQGRPDPSLHTSNLVSGYARTLDAVEAAAPGTRLVVFGASGRLPFDAVACLRADPSDISGCTSPRGEVVDDALVDAQRDLAERRGAAFADTSRWLCTRNACPPIIAGRLVRWDDHHLSPGVTGWLAPMIEPVVFGE